MAAGEVSAMQAAILAGGLGTRLGALLAGRNKPMAPVAGRPFLEFLLRQLRRNGIADVVLCVGHRGELIREHFGAGEPWDLRLRYSWEKELLGTGGAVKLAAPLLAGDDFLVLNGDSLFDVALAELVAFHREHGAAVTLALSRTDDPGRFGTVELGPGGQVLRFVEKGQGEPGGLINAGVYVFNRQVLDRIPEGRVVSLERDVFSSLVGRGLYGLPLAGYFVDIGVPETYAGVQDDARLVRAAGLAASGHPAEPARPAAGRPDARR
jgi:NDP-sugar pyrophosphorylase family protein